MKSVVHVYNGMLGHYMNQSSMLQVVCTDPVSGPEPCSSVAQRRGSLGLFCRERSVCVGEPLGAVVRIVSHSLFDVSLYLTR